MVEINISYIEIRKRIKFLLVFFCVLSTVGCEKKIEEKLTLNYQAQQTISIEFIDQNEIGNFRVSLENNSSPILGTFSKEGNSVRFKPVIPFSYNTSYEVFSGEEKIYEFTTNALVTDEQPKVVEIYPRTNLVPENLLKMYIVFSKPMQQSQPSLNFIKVFNTTTGKPVDIFLPLDNELWNADKTRLTLWLDPGRIKKDLIPNRTLGIPIKEGNTYELKIDKSFTDIHGNELEESAIKRFSVGQRDAESPTLKGWNVEAPKANSLDGLKITFDEPLDILLAQEMIELIDPRHTLFAGNCHLSEKPNQIIFFPEKKWERGVYSIMVNAKLEDLAGNNFNRLFDVDLENPVKKDDASGVILKFTIQ